MMSNYENSHINFTFFGWDETGQAVSFQVLVTPNLQILKVLIHTNSAELVRH